MSPPATSLRAVASEVDMVSSSVMPNVAEAPSPANSPLPETVTLAMPMLVLSSYVTSKSPLSMSPPILQV